MIGTDVQRAADLLRAGKLVAIPTETVYGLAANALDETAVSLIFAAKQRPSFDPLIIHLADFGQADRYCQDIPELAYRLASSFMPGPLTLLLQKRDNIPDLVTSGSPQVAVRIPAHPMSQALLSQLDFPLAAPSANPFGYISPTTAQHVADQLGDPLSYILDGGPCSVGVESTIVGFEAGTPVVLRKGGTTVESLKARVDHLEVRAVSTSNPTTPGQLKSHYAPRVPVLLGDLEELKADYAGDRVGVVSFRQKIKGIPEQQQVVLSPQGNYAEAARNLFVGMRYLDGLPLVAIIAELLPEEGLGRAINDRLRRAAAKS